MVSSGVHRSAATKDEANVKDFITLDEYIMAEGYAKTRQTSKSFARDRTEERTASDILGGAQCVVGTRERYW